MARDDIDDTPHRDVAVQARGAAFGDLDAVDAGERHPRPIHPAAKRIIERNAVQQDQRAALTAWPDATQRDALCGRLRHEAAGPPEQAEARHLTQHIIGEERGRRLDGFAGEDAHARWHVAEPLLGPRRGHGDGFEQRGGLDDDLDRAARSRCLLRLLGEPSRPDDEVHLARVRCFDGEAAVRAGDCLALRTRRRPDDDGGSGHRAAARVFHDA